MVLGASWLWRCPADAWQLIAPGQFARGLLVRAGHAQRVVECAGEVVVP
jgi:hypothetical protein